MRTQDSSAHLSKASRLAELGLLVLPLFTAQNSNAQQSLPLPLPPDQGGYVKSQSGPSPSQPTQMHGFVSEQRGNIECLFPKQVTEGERVKILDQIVKSREQVHLEFFNISPSIAHLVPVKIFLWRDEGELLKALENSPTYPKTVQFNSGQYEIHSALTGAKPFEHRWGYILAEIEWKRVSQSIDPCPKWYAESIARFGELLTVQEQIKYVATEKNKLASLKTILNRHSYEAELVAAQPHTLGAFGSYVISFATFMIEKFGSEQYSHFAVQVERLGPDAAAANLRRTFLGTDKAIVAKDLAELEKHFHAWLDQRVIDGSRLRIVPEVDFTKFTLEPKPDKYGFKVATHGPIRLHCNSYVTDQGVSELLRTVYGARERALTRCFPDATPNDKTHVVDVFVCDNPDAFKHLTGLNPEVDRASCDPESVSGNKETRIVLNRSHRSFTTGAIAHEWGHAFYNSGKLSWADEGIAQLCESENEVRKLIQSYRDKRGGEVIENLQKLFNTDRYPAEKERKASFYHFSAGLTLYLAETHDLSSFRRFVQTGKNQSYEKAAQELGYRSLDALELKFIEWIKDYPTGYENPKSGPK